MLAATKSKTVTRVAFVAASVLLGSALAFLLGAQAGARLDHKTRSVTIAHAPPAAADLRTSSRTAVAHK